MAEQRVINAIQKKQIKCKVLEFERPFESTEDAKNMIDTSLERMAKTLAFRSQFGAVILIVSGEAKVDPVKFKKKFGFRPMMLDVEELMEFTGYAPGSVSPIGLSHNKVKIYMDASIKRFTEGDVYPSAGEDNSALAITACELYRAADCQAYVNVCNNWNVYQLIN
ncbi:MAG: YbaK/EbsC family protein [Lachnospiraceae bacterium]